eukprot:306809-Prymnesium_polylepis.1
MAMLMVPPLAKRPGLTKTPPRLTPGAKRRSKQRLNGATRHTRRTMSFIMKELLIVLANRTTMSPNPPDSDFWGIMSPL